MVLMAAALMNGGMCLGAAAAEDAAETPDETADTGDGKGSRFLGGGGGRYPL